MHANTVNRSRINESWVTIELGIDKTFLSSGEILTARAAFSQKPKNLLHFVTSECTIVTPVGSSLEILDIRENAVASEIDPHLSLECEKVNRYFAVFCGDAIVQVSAVVLSKNGNKHHIITDPLLVRMSRPRRHIAKIKAVK